MLSEGLQITENSIQLGRESRDLNDNIRKRRTEIEAEALIRRKSIAIVSKRESIGQDLTKDRNKDREEQITTGKIWKMKEKKRKREKKCAGKEKNGVS